MPTYEDRLSALCESYRSIFGIESELSESVPDYQLLSVFARSLDDASSLVLDAFHQMNPLYASGQALDLLLPQYGLARLPGESDAAVRSRIVTALAGGGRTMESSLVAALRAVSGVKRVALYVNDTDAADAKGIPAHSLCAVVHAGSLQSLAEAIFRKKAPGIGTYGTTTRQVVDENGVSHSIAIYRPSPVLISFDLEIKTYDGFDNALLDTLREAIIRYVTGFDLGQSLVVPSVYGVCYAAAGDKASTFAISDLTATSTAAGGTTRIKVPAAWNTYMNTSEELIQITISN